jgi:uncharacterized protein YecE (DUF72 family)
MRWTRMSPINIGTAGWTIPRQVAGRFPSEGTALERYAARFRVAEINSSFHRPHRFSTWARWRDITPDGFRFSVKVPKVVTHQRKLVDIGEPLAAFLEEAGTLGPKLAVLLVQLPPKLAFDAKVAESFFASLLSLSGAAVVCEPRHPTWFTPDAERLMIRHKVARVAADPAICEAAGTPGGWRETSYWRLHGSPVMYRSSYADRIARYAELLAEEAAKGRDVWCIFDNTASPAAAGDALALLDALVTG